MFHGGFPIDRAILEILLEIKSYAEKVPNVTKIAYDCNFVNAFLII